MRFEQSVHVPASREALWCLLARTDRLNREVGLPPIEFAFAPREAGGSDITATVRLAGLTMRYREHPFEWARPSGFHVRRSFFGGPVREIVCGATLEEAGGETDVTIWAELEPAGAAGHLACRAIGIKSVADVAAACRRFGDYLAGRAPSAYPHQTGRPPADRQRLERAREEMIREGADGALTERLAHLAATAPAGDAQLIRPFAVADSWGAPRLDVLRTCLTAARVGLLELRWRLLCPACRGAPRGVAHLRDLTATAHCAHCNIHFDAEFDRSVEVCFNVAPAIRPLRDRIYCVGGPMLSPQAFAQWALPPRARRTTTLCLPPGRYTLNSLQCGATVPITVDAPGTVDAPAMVDAPGMVDAPAMVAPSGSAAVSIGIVAGSPRHRLDVTADRVVGGAVWNVENRTDHPITVRLEAPEWQADTATAALVTSLQAFRDQFSSEALAPGAEMAVRQIGVLFSDLKGSTAMYRMHGDAPSYGRVRRHFDLMAQQIAAHDGAIVKTIGDAVMAVFADPARGVAAALAIQREARRSEDNLVVKLGFHWGPALAVNLNDHLDYFGQTVNLAARLQRESQGGDIVLTAALAGDAGALEVLTAQAVVLDRFTAEVRGLDAPVEMLRLAPV